ncbi:DNA repair protein RadC [bacterium]|nr:DNA repair protein RadC [bacterium]
MLPREKLETQGKDSLSNADLVAIILRTGSKAENIIELSHRLISEYLVGEAEFEFTYQEISDKFKLSKLKSMQLEATFELGRRLFKETNRDKILLNSSDKIAKFHQALKSETAEKFFAVLLDTRLRLITSKLVAAGNLNSILIEPKEILTAALRSNAAGIVLVHNHPSGESQPSQEDIDFTKRLVRASNIIGIAIVDHIIIGDNYYSFKKSGKL